jgi:DNA-binding NarL/FixJ family response regulator
VPEGDAQVRILLADGQSLFREAVKVVLGNEPGLEVVAEAGDGLDAVAEAERVRPNIALVDLNLPNCDGVRATYLITERVPACRVVVLADEEDESVLVNAIEAGASGYLTKESPLAELIQATRAIHRGETLIPRQMLGPLLKRLIVRRREQDEALQRIAKLTKREREVLAYLAEGRDNDGIAQALVISPQTARTHVQNMFTKLGVHSRLGAAAFVTRNGILDELVGPDGPISVAKFRAREDGARRPGSFRSAGSVTGGATR